MNQTRAQFRRTIDLTARLVILVAGLTCLLSFPWDTPLVAGRVACVIVGIRVWVLGLALVATAAVWVPDKTVQADL